MKQTAVQWLRNFYDDHPESRGIAEHIWDKVIEMEKEQIRNGGCPYIGGWEDDEEFELWFKEEYGGS